MEQAIAERRADAIQGVGDAVDMADFIAVIGGNGHLADTKAAFEKLEDDLRVEVPIRSQFVQRNAAQGLHGIGAVSGMEFRQARAEQRVLHPGQNLVSVVLVGRHVSAEGRAGNHHARTHHHIGLPGLKRLQQIAHHLRSVLAIAMEQNDDVKTLLHGVLVSPSLIAAIHQVHRVPVDGQMRAFPLLLDGLADLVGAVLAGVIEDEDLLNFRAKVGRNAMQRVAQVVFRVIGNHENADSGFTHESDQDYNG